MNLLIVGANGRTGRMTVDEALRRGHNVRGFVRGDRHLPLQMSPGAIEFGDATRLADIKRAIKDIDVVISTLGHNRHSSSDVQSKATKNLVRAAAAINPDLKIVSLTGTGVRQSGDNITFIDWLLNAVLKIVDRRRLEDGISHAAILKRSPQKWVIVRVLKLFNRHIPGAVALRLHGPAKTFVSRKYVASLLVDAAEQSRWDQQMPVVSKLR